MNGSQDPRNILWLLVACTDDIRIYIQFWCFCRSKSKMRNVQEWWQRNYCWSFWKLRYKDPRIPKPFSIYWSGFLFSTPSLMEFHNHLIWLASFLIVLHLHVNSKGSSRRELDINLFLKTLENTQLSQLTQGTPDGEGTNILTRIMS